MRLIYSAILVAVLAAGLHAQTACNPQLPARFTAGFEVAQGQIRLHKDEQGRFANVQVTLPERLKPCLSGPRVPADVAQTLAADLDAALAAAHVFPWYALSTREQDGPFPAKLSACLGLDRKTAAPPQTWKEFQASFATCGFDVGRARNAFTAFQSSLSKNIGALLPIRPLASDFVNGSLSFDIAAYGRPWSASLPATLPPGFPLPQASLVEELNSNDEGLWRAPRIEAVLNEFLSRRGWTPAVSVGQPARNAAPAIVIAPVPPLTQVSFLPSATTVERERILSRLLSDAQFAHARQVPLSTNTVGISFESVDLSGLTPPVLFNQLAFSEAQQEIAGLGFTVATVTDGGKAQIQVTRTVSNTPAKSVKGVQTRPSEEAMLQHAAPTPAAAQPVPEQPGVDPACMKAGATCAAPNPPKEKKGFIGGGFDYSPGQGVRPIAAVEYQRLFGPGAVSLQTGSANQFFVVQGNASFDFICFDGDCHLHHRLSLNLNGGSDVVNNRLIDGRKLMERRNGGKARIQLEVIHAPIGNSLLVYAEGGSETVELSDKSVVDAPQTFLSDQLTSFRFGAAHQWSRMDALHPHRSRLEARWRRGVAAPGWHSRFDAIGQFHVESTGRLAFEVNGAASVSSLLTPIYELPSLGGSDSVRGFRADDFLARRTWNLQPEFWFPVTRGGSGSASFWQKIRVAPFVDAGGAYLMTQGKSGVEAGAGVGIRFPLGPATLRLDWARRITNGATAPGPDYGRFYFSLSTPIY